MPQHAENPITFRLLYWSSLISIREYCCQAGRGGPAALESSPINNIVLMRQGAFCKHFGRRNVTADVNQVVFFSKGSTYRVSHPGECGDRGTVLDPSPRVLADILSEPDPSFHDRPGRPFPFVLGPCPSAVFWRHHEFVQRLRASESQPLDSLWADSIALQLTAEVLEAAFTRNGLAHRRRRQGTQADHAERVEAAKHYFAGRLGKRIKLEVIAQAVHLSPLHLSRVFQERTGMPIHRYLTRLRLRTSLERLADGADDLTALALELGFSSHSHFTDSFRSEFGQPPSRMRRNARGRTFREMSKNLEV